MPQTLQCYSLLQMHHFFSPQEELVKSATFRYITDAITPDEALAILKAKEATKNQREAIVHSQGCVALKYCLPSFIN